MESAEPVGGSGATQEQSREQLLGTDCLIVLIRWCDFNTNSNPCVAFFFKKTVIALFKNLHRNKDY